MKSMEKGRPIPLLMLAIALLISAGGVTVDRALLSCELGGLDLDGRMDFYETHVAAADFGNRQRAHPAAVLYPASVRDIATLVKSVYRCGPSSEITIAAKGHAHSLNGQAQARNGVVVEMTSLKGAIKVHRQDGNNNNNNNNKKKKNMNNSAYVDVSGGDLWIHVLNKTLEEGLAPRSWTDYLYLTVGGTLSNAGISGQAFRHGPQISNVFQLEVVTGRGEVVTCSKDQNAELFHAVLGGLGQFGIITKARIALEPAPDRVRWIRVLYSDFRTFSKDQEYLISELTFDYVEGFVIVNNEGLLNNWRSSFFSPQNPVKVGTLNTKGRVLYCLEMTVNYRDNDAAGVDEAMTSLLSSLNFIPSSVFTTDLPYVDFLDRVHVSELKLRANGLWEVPHPWLNLFIPATKIAEFDARVFKQIIRNTSGGPILIYPMNRNRWDGRMSAMTPEEDIFYLVGLLRSALPSAKINESHNLQYLTDQNDQILDFCKSAGIEAKQYLPHYTDQSEWRNHFGKKWKKFVDWKATYDPNAILAPGQRIFSKSRLPISAAL